ncbi:MAG: hypothetical protein V4501_12640 [Pseudomonadota bacterium]
MFERSLFQSPSKRGRKLVIYINTNTSDYKQAEENTQRSLTGNEEKEAPEFTHAQLLAANIDDATKLILDNTLNNLDKLTIHYLNQLKAATAAILSSWPVEILEEFASRTQPLVSLTVIVANREYTFDCQTLRTKAAGYFPQWLDEHDKQIFLIKLNHVTTIYHYIHDPNKLSVAKILALKTYLEKVEVGRELREPPVAPADDTLGSQYLKEIIHLNDNCCVEIENLIKHSNLATLQRQTIIRMEWLCLHYLNNLADKLLLLANQLSLPKLIALNEKSSNIKSDNRFIYVTREDEQHDKKKYKIHAPILLEAIHLFPSNEHYYIEKCSTALNLLQQIEEINPKFDPDKLNDFFVLIESDAIKESLYKKSPSCLGYFGLGFFYSDPLVVPTTEFMTNIKKIQLYYDREKHCLPEISTALHSSGLSLSPST